MKELIVLSGKGGTGKTSITASFAMLAQRPVVADCDVDAADLRTPVVRVVLGHVVAPHLLLRLAGSDGSVMPRRSARPGRWAPFAVVPSRARSWPILREALNFSTL